MDGESESFNAKSLPEGNVSFDIPCMMCFSNHIFPVHLALLTGVEGLAKASHGG